MSSRKESGGKSERKTLIYRIVFIVALAGFLICGGILLRNWWVVHQANKLNDKLAEQSTQPETQPKETEPPTETEEEPDYLERLGITVPEKNLNWQELWEINEDIYAWIYIPNTDIDRPVLQHPTETDYYLTHNLDHTGPRPACIYSQIVNSKDFTDLNTILYGHRGVMFHDLGLFEDKEFFDNNRYVFIYLPDGQVLVYDIVAAVSFHDRLIPAMYDINSEYDCQMFLNEVLAVRDMNSHVREGYEISEGNKILTLSTCFPYPTRPDERFLVVGTLVNDPEKMEAEGQALQETEGSN